jgi:hypothetical protein
MGSRAKSRRFRAVAERFRCTPRLPLRQMEVLWEPSTGSREFSHFPARGELSAPSAASLPPSSAAGNAPNDRAWPRTVSARGGQRPGASVPRATPSHRGGGNWGTTTAPWPSLSAASIAARCAATAKRRTTALGRERRVRCYAFAVTRRAAHSRSDEPHCAAWISLEQGFRVLISA